MKELRNLEKLKINKMKNSKYRVLQKNDKFYIQRKTIFGWSYIITDTINTDNKYFDIISHVYYHFLMTAIAFVLYFISTVFLMKIPLLIIVGYSIFIGVYRIFAYGIYYTDFLSNAHITIYDILKFEKNQKNQKKYLYHYYNSETDTFETK